MGIIELNHQSDIFEIDTSKENQVLIDMARFHNILYQFILLRKYKVNTGCRICLFSSFDIYDFSE